MIRRADIDWTGVIWLAVATVVALTLCVTLPASGQERQRLVRPSAFFQYTRTALYGPFDPVGADRYLFVFMHPNFRIGTSANDESHDGYTPLPMWRVRTVKVIGEDGQPHDHHQFCAVLMLSVQSLDYDQRWRIDRRTLPIPILDTDTVAFEHRPWWSISTSIEGDEVKCVSCDWRDEKMAPLRGVAIPNGGCQ